MDIIQPYENRTSYLQVFIIAFGLLGFELISYLPQLLHVDSRVVTVPYRGVYFFFCICTLINFKWFNNVRFSKEFVPVLFFWLFYTFRVIYDLNFEEQIIKTPIFDFILFAFVLSLFPILPLMIKLNLETLQKARFVLFIMAIAVNFFGFASNFQNAQPEAVGTRFLGNEILNPISYGQAGVALVILSITYFFKQDLVRKLFLLGCMVIGLANIAFAASRGPMIQLGIVLIFFIVFNIRNIGYKNLLIMAILFLGVGFYFRDYLLFFDSLLARLEETGINTEGGGNEERYFLFKGALEQFYNAPFFGDFIEERRFGGYPHNVILESFMAMGVIGGVLIIYIYIVSIKNALALIKIEPTAWLALLLIMQLIAGLTSGSIYASFSFWALISICANLYLNKKLYN